MTANIRLVPQPLPFDLPQWFRDFLARHPHEYGAPAGKAERLPPSTTRAWSIESDGDGCIGYAWITDETDSGAGHCWSMGVRDDMQGNGAAKAALPIVEADAAQAGIGELRAQVNGSEGNALRFRHWLLRCGYVPIKEKLYAAFPDSEYCERVSRPVIMRKQLPKRAEDGG